METNQIFWILDLVSWVLVMAGNAATCVIALGVSVIAYKLKRPD